MWSSHCSQFCSLQRCPADSANAGDVKTYTLHVPYNRFKQESGKGETAQRFVAAIQSLLVEATTSTILLCIFISRCLVRSTKALTPNHYRKFLSFKKLVHKPSSPTIANTAVTLLWALLLRLQASAQLPGGVGHILRFHIAASKLDVMHLPQNVSLEKSLPGNIMHCKHTPQNNQPKGKSMGDVFAILLSCWYDDYTNKRFYKEWVFPLI